MIEDEEEEDEQIKDTERKLEEKNKQPTPPAP